MLLEPDEAVTVVTRSESFMLLPLVLEDAPWQITGHSDVERPATASHDVCEIAALVHVAHRTLICR